MKKTDEGVADIVSLRGVEGEGTYVLGIADTGDVALQHLAHFRHDTLPDPAIWKSHFLVRLIKTGWFEYRFEVTQRMVGVQYLMITNKPIGKMLLGLIQDQQAAA